MSNSALPAVTIPAIDTLTVDPTRVPAELLRDLVVPGDRAGAVKLLDSLR